MRVSGRMLPDHQPAQAAGWPGIGRKSAQSRRAVMRAGFASAKHQT